MKKSDKLNMREFMHSLFAEDIIDWKQNKKRSGIDKNVENKG